MKVSAVIKFWGFYLPNVSRLEVGMITACGFFRCCFFGFRSCGFRSVYCCINQSAGYHCANHCLRNTMGLSLIMSLSLSRSSGCTSWKF